MARVSHGVTRRKSFGDLPNSALPVANTYCIYRVHKHLRDVNKKAYKPEIIAIGPYHHRKDNLKKKMMEKMMEEHKVRYLKSNLKMMEKMMEEHKVRYLKSNLKMMEEHKVRYLESLLQRNGQTLEMYASAIKELEKDARRCYAEPINELSPDEFTEMLVLDGCFIIELLRKDNEAKEKNDPIFQAKEKNDPIFQAKEKNDPIFQAKEKNDPIFRMEWMMNSLQRDLLLFENQIPFFVLRKLFDLIEGPGKHERLIYLVVKFWESLYPGVQHNFEKKMSEEKKIDYHHLLHLVHRYYRPPNLEKKESEKKKKDYHLLDLANRYFCLPRPAEHVGCCNWRFTGDATKKEEILIIHSATELTNANVQFKKKTDSKSTLFDVEFEDGVMRMPRLTIEDRTECFFRNFIAYEHYFPDNQHNYVGDYAMLLNCLIDSPADVGILSQARIINNLLGDDKAAAKFINRLTETVSGPRRYFMYDASSGLNRHFRYNEIFKSLDAHYKRFWNRALAALRRDYFNSPWAYATFVAALAILILTVVQTAFSILQVKQCK